MEFYKRERVEFLKRRAKFLGDLFENYQVEIIRNSDKFSFRQVPSRAGLLCVELPLYKVVLYLMNKSFTVFTITPFTPWASDSILVDTTIKEEGHFLSMEVPYRLSRVDYHNNLVKFWREYNGEHFTEDEYYETIVDIINYWLVKVLGLDGKFSDYHFYIHNTFTRTGQFTLRIKNVSLLDSLLRELNIEKVKEQQYTSFLTKLYQDFVFTVDIVWLDKWILLLGDVIYETLDKLPEMFLKDVKAKFC